MCGLAGIVNSNLTLKEHAAFEKLLLLSHWRGADATGVIWTHDYWEKGTRKIAMNYLKDDISSPLFLARHRKSFDNEYQKNHPKALMGHCRWATVGKLDRNNAHPFNNKYLIGMHNGTIQGNFENSSKFDTDSEALLFNIGEKGLVQALEPLKYRSPAYALTWIDKRNNTLNFFRNDARPLWFARNSEGVLAWASEKEFLEISLPRERVAIDMLYTIKPHNLATIHLDVHECTAIKNIDWKDHTEDLKIHTYSSGATFPVPSAKAVETENEEEIEDDSQDDDIVWLLNEAVEKKEYIWRLAKGCSWCDWKLDWNTRDSAAWINEHEYICTGCQKNDGVTEYIKEEQAKYWLELREAYLKENPLKTDNDFKPKRQLRKELKERSQKAKKLQPIKDVMKQQGVPELNDAPWDNENGVSVH